MMMFNHRVVIGPVIRRYESPPPGVARVVTTGMEKIAMEI